MGHHHMTQQKIMTPVEQMIVDYAGYLVAAVVGLGLAWTRLRRELSSTSLQEKTDTASGTYIEGLIEDHQRLVTQLQEAHDDRTANAEKVGALTAEVNILRGQIGEVKELLELLSSKLDEANGAITVLERDLMTKEGEIMRLTMERDAALIRAKTAEKESGRLKTKYES